MNSINDCVVSHFLFIPISRDEILNLFFSIKVALQTPCVYAHWSLFRATFSTEGIQNRCSGCFPVEIQPLCITWLFIGKWILTCKQINKKTFWNKTLFLNQKLKWLTLFLASFLCTSIFLSVVQKQQSNLSSRETMRN